MAVYEPVINALLLSCHSQNPSHRSGELTVNAAQDCKNQANKPRCDDLSYTCHYSEPETINIHNYW